MRPVRTTESNITLTLPGGTAENDLPAQRAMLYNAERGETEQDAQLGFVTTWQPNEAEARALEAGACVELTVWGKGHPPVAVGVTSAVVPERELIDRGHVDRALGHLYGELKARAEDDISNLVNHPASRGEDPAEHLMAALFPDPEVMADLWAASVEATKPKPAGYTDPDDPAERAKLDPPEAG